MSVSAISLTYFLADKIACPRVQGQSSPYRITTYKGPQLGLLGCLPAALCQVYELNAADAANSELYENSSPGLFERLTGLRRQG